jgi:hypothetical protein
MKNVIVLLVVSVFVVLFSMTLFPLSMRTDSSVSPQRQARNKDSQKQSNSDSEITATFKIYVYGLPKDLTELIFTEQSDAVYLSVEKPNEVYVAQPGITWGDFINTLPLSMTEECLISELNQEYCTTGKEKLWFFINGEEQPDLLAQTIQSGDEVLITFGELTEAELNYQLSQF